MLGRSQSHTSNAYPSDICRLFAMTSQTVTQIPLCFGSLVLYHYCQTPLRVLRQDTSPQAMSEGGIRRCLTFVAFACFTRDLYDNISASSQKAPMLSINRHGNHSVLASFFAISFLIYNDYK